MFGNIADSRTITLWRFGYYDGGLKNTVIDVSSMQNSSRDLVRYCMDHSDSHCVANQRSGQHRPKASMSVPT
jgi:hypothetical protein